MRQRFKRPSAALIIACIALFISIGGVGYAASKIGTNDIKNGAVTAKKLHKKAVKTKKINKEAVTNGKLAPDAVTTDKIAADAITTDKIADGQVQQPDVAGGYYPTSGGAPSGTTLRGDWALRVGNNAAGQRMQLAISYGVLGLTASPTQHYVPAGAATPAGCTGDVDNPGADPGNLCVFEKITTNITAGTQTVFNMAGNPGADPWGAGIAANATAAGDSRFRGSWAVTAP
jgi:hypothetical protein